MEGLPLKSRGHHRATGGPRHLQGAVGCIERTLWSTVRARRRRGPLHAHWTGRVLVCDAVRGAFRNVNPIVAGEGDRGCAVLPSRGTGGPLFAKSDVA